MMHHIRFRLKGHHFAQALVRRQEGHAPAAISLFQSLTDLEKQFFTGLAVAESAAVGWVYNNQPRIWCQRPGVYVKKVFLQNLYSIAKPEFIDPF